MTDQMVLIECHPAWRLDSRTRERGIKGVAAARRALDEARKRVATAEPISGSDPEDTEALAPAA